MHLPISHLWPRCGDLRCQDPIPGDPSRFQASFVTVVTAMLPNGLLLFTAPHPHKRPVSRTTGHVTTRRRIQLSFKILRTRHTH
ncbi:hypothetical protein GDO81_011698 [Engystomops pustulosus]|uniref:Uncharacterized protein n=1 Tax=Engystomops pustulosus TaxID=76066 RepID=A0AAV7BGG0_ENGPU|nr:hypothetical protein GDO81_011698 [Engystomops pustulosus]